MEGGGREIVTWIWFNHHMLYVHSGTSTGIVIHLYLKGRLSYKQGKLVKLLFRTDRCCAFPGNSLDLASAGWFSILRCFCKITFLADNQRIHMLNLWHWAILISYLHYLVTLQTISNCLNHSAAIFIVSFSFIY